MYKEATPHSLFLLLCIAAHVELTLQSSRYTSTPILSATCDTNRHPGISKCKNPKMMLIQNSCRGTQQGCQLVTLGCTSNPLQFKILYYFKIRSHFGKLVQNFELKRVVGAHKGHQFAPLEPRVNLYAVKSFLNLDVQQKIQSCQILNYCIIN